jgi:hypothetical protein
MLIIAGSSANSLPSFIEKAYVRPARPRTRPQFPGDPQTIHWSIPDPAAEPGSDADTCPAFERTATELETRIRFLLHRINNDTPKREVSRS